MGNLQLVGQPQAFLGVSLGEGAPAGLPDLLTSPTRSNTANRPGPQTMPEYRFNKSNATSIIIIITRPRVCRQVTLGGT